MSEHIGELPLVMVSPADFVLITGGSDERRRFADMIISQYDREYLFSLIAYNKALAQRNALLKEYRPLDEALMEIWEEQMATYGADIFRKRKEMVARLSSVFETYYATVSGLAEQAALSYESQLEVSDFAEQLRSARQRDKVLGYSSVGIHKDDLKMMLDGYPLKRMGSQGQSKTFLISLKLAQYSFLREHHGSKPILLLDDVGSCSSTENISKFAILSQNFNLVSETSIV